MVEKTIENDSIDLEKDRIKKPTSRLDRLLSKFRIELGGIAPTPIEERVDTRLYNIFTVWATFSTSLLAVVSGSLAPIAFGLSFRDSVLIIIFFSIPCIIPVAYLSTLAPKTGLRQMVQARFSFGYYFVFIPVILNLATLIGFCTIGTVIGAQTLAAVSPNGELSTTVAIVIISLLAFLLSFTGHKFIHYYDRFSWIVVCVGMIIAIGTGGSNFKKAPLNDPKATVRGVMSFGAYIAGYFIAYGGIVSDFGTYYRPDSSSIKVFTYTYLGYAVPSIALFILGSAIGSTIPYHEPWSVIYEQTHSISPIVGSMLSPAGGFGRFVLVVLALSTIGNIGGTCYSISLNFQVIGLGKIPRTLLAIVVTAIVIPLSIQADRSFLLALENFVGVIGYWSAAFVGIVLTEHLYFRRGDARGYTTEIAEDPKKLPSGVAAILAGCLPFALVIPCMNQVWFTGPIGKTTGDLGFQVAFVLACIFYVIFGHFRIGGRSM